MRLFLLRVGSALEPGSDSPIFLSGGPGRCYGHVMTASLSAPAIGILAVGAYAPAAVITNAHYATRLDTSDDWITSRTGIRERRHAAPDES